MRLIFIITVVFLVAAVAYQWVAGRFDRYARQLMDQVRGDRPSPGSDLVKPATLPQLVHTYIEHAGVATRSAPRSVHLWQSAELRMGPGKPWKPLNCEQVIAIGKPGFVWYAEQPYGPFSMIRIVDAYVTGHGYLHARLFASLPVANAAGPDLDRSELMRYLAELAWAPDAMRYNDALRWRPVDNSVVEVEADSAGGVARVRLYFNQQGDIVEVQADERGSMENGIFVPRPWRGVFSDHREMGGRRIPAQAEVGYVYDDGYSPYWRGRITDYRVE